MVLKIKIHPAVHFPEFVQHLYIKLKKKHIKKLTIIFFLDSRTFFSHTKTFALHIVANKRILEKNHNSK